MQSAEMNYDSRGYNKRIMRKGREEKKKEIKAAGI